MKKIQLLVILFTSFFFQCSIAQNAQYITKKTVTGKAKKAFDKGMEHLRAKDNEKALKEFTKALNIAPNFIDAQLFWAGVQYNLKNLEAAEKGFEKGIAMNPEYNAGALYTLAAIEEKQRKLDEALEHYKAYVDHPKARAKLKAKSLRKIEVTEFAATAIKSPVLFDPVSLGKNINSQHAEYLPTVTADEETLIYTLNNGQEDFYISKRVDGVWQKGVPISEINTRDNEGAQSISADGRFLVFTACSRKNGYGSCDLYFSEVRDGRWTPAANIGAPINSRGWESQPSISADGKALYFASERAGGQGGIDIWVSKRKSDGKWGKPTNLGDAINTSDNDQSPFIHPDGQTLYFMSKGHPGMGGYDLYLSRKEADGTWGKPENLGFPINTKANEGALAISLDGKTAYFASDIKDFENIKESAFDNPAKGNDTDIYSFTLHDKARPKPVTYVKAKVFDEKTKKELIANVEFVDLSTGKTHTSSITDNDGEFLVVLPMGKNYALNVSKEKYLFHSENFALAKTASLEKPFLMEIGLQAIPEKIASANTPSTTSLPKAKPIILKNVFFETGSAELLNESLVELNQLKKLLEDNPNMRIQINGHTDNVGSDADNLTLSDNRAKAVYDYLVENSISASRLSYKGFGETQPIDANDTPEGRQNNRRTTFVIF